MKTMKKRPKSRRITRMVAANVPAELWEVLSWLAFDRGKPMADIVRDAIVLILKECGEYYLYDWDGMVPSAHGEAARFGTECTSPGTNAPGGAA